MGVTMVIIEKPDFSYWWECSGCGTEFKATRKFEKNKACPKCNGEINRWIDIDDYEE